MSEETTIFESLERLAHSPGYAYILAALCYKHKCLPSDSVIELTDGTRAGSGETIVRNEIGLLVGLFSKSERDLSVPTIENVRKVIDETELLLSKLQEAIMENFKTSITSSFSGIKSGKEEGEVAFLREAMIYSGESAYTFQYRDMFVDKYADDDQWIFDNKGFSISNACTVYDSIMATQRQRVLDLCDESKPHYIDHRKLLDAYIVSESTVVRHSGLSPRIVRAFMEAFSLRSLNDGFSGISEFNETNATPLIPVDSSRYVLFDHHTLAESLYESPFYWMISDKEYSAIHAEQRGQFTEDFCAKRLRRIFGQHRVYTNIKIPKSQGHTYTEIDVLAHFADRVVLVQAKSKRLTVDARRGNISAIEGDFRKGIQHACDQGYDSASLLFDRSIREILSNQFDVHLPHSIKEVFLLTILSDHYPALSVQVRHFLNRRDNADINTPLVVDIFALDVITEFLDNPLYFLSYLKRRSQYSQRIIAVQELTILAQHLSSNLWIKPDIDLMLLDGEFCDDLNRAIVRRRCFGEIHSIPTGILTMMTDKIVGKILESIRANDDPIIFEIGLKLLEMSSRSLEEFSQGCSKIIQRTIHDTLIHDFSMSMSEGKFGLTVHSNFLSEDTARDRLRDHCQRRKYQVRSECWFGLCLSPVHVAPRFGIRVQCPWEYSSEMEQKIKTLGRPRKSIRSFVGVARSGPKVGRNDPCPCGSGRKYKKCCLSDEL